jgi:hypothetical protein
MNASMKSDDGVLMETPRVLDRNDEVDTGKKSGLLFDVEILLMLLLLLLWLWLLFELLMLLSSGFAHSSIEE